MKIKHCFQGWMTVLLPILAITFVSFTVAPTGGEVDEMPRFPGCEDKASAKEKVQCANGKMIQFIINNLKYPKAAKEKKVEGKVFISFTVNKKGKVTKAKIKKDIGAGCGDAALAVVNKMKEVTWIPGKKGGKAVGVEMVLPFMFKLPKKKD